MEIGAHRHREALVAQKRRQGRRAPAEFANKRMVLSQEYADFNRKERQRSERRRHRAVGYEREVEFARLDLIPNARRAVMHLEVYARSFARNAADGVGK